MDNNNLHFISYHFNPDCFKLAREFRGLQKNELAKRIGISPSAISQFENGEIKPNAQTVAKISMALGFPPSFFGHQNNLRIISPDQCHFRSLRSCSPMEFRQVVSGSSIIGKIVEFIDSHVELPKEEVTNCMITSIGTNEDIEQAAVKVRNSWGLGLGPIDNILYLFEAKGILIFRLLNNSKKVDAFSHWHGGRPFVFLNAEKGSGSRSRYDAAHELGHLIMHPDYLPGDRTHESQADRFASAFLMPRETFMRECPKRLIWPIFIELKKRWKVSLAALVRRAKDLGNISEDTYRRANVQINQKGWKTKEPYEFPTEQPTVFPQSIELLAKEGWSLSTIAEKLSISEIDLRNLIYADSIEQNCQRNSIIDDENRFKKSK